MTIEQWDQFHQARPFRPVSVFLGDGRSFRVNHPEFAGRTPSGRTIFVSSGHDAMAAIDLLLVTSLEYTNGQPRRSRRTKPG